MDLGHVLELFKLGEKLKMELRHSWLSDGRRESVAEHTWMLTLLAMAVEPHLRQPVQMERLLKMLIIHDLVEARASDVPAFETMDNPERKAIKQANEIAAIAYIRDLVGGENGRQFYELWFEFEQKATYEAQVANALDKLEAQLQHNEAALDTWLPVEQGMTFMLGRHTDFDPVLSHLKDLIQQEGDRKMQAGGIDTSVFKDRHPEA